MKIDISTMVELQIEAESIQKFVDITMSEDMTEAVLRGNDLSSYLARTSKMLADAKYHYNLRMRTDVIETLKRIALEAPHATSTAVNLLIKTLCRDEQYLVDWIERLNNTVGKQIEWCRTIISKAKEEMRLTGSM